MNQQVVVVIGAGGMGERIARARAVGRHLRKADFQHNARALVASTLHYASHEGSDAHVDVGECDSVKRLARAASEFGSIGEVVHTAGLSPARPTSRPHCASTSTALPHSSKNSEQ